MAKMPADLRSLCRSYTARTVQLIGGLATAEGVEDDIRIRAIHMLWERGWGKAAQPVTGEDGEGAIEITVRVINEGKK